MLGRSGMTGFIMNEHCCVWLARTRLHVRGLALAALLLVSAAAPVHAESRHSRNPSPQATMDTARAEQQSLLIDQVSRLAPQRPGVHDFYFVGVAGYGDQNVFRKEVERVRGLFDTRFGTAGRSILLVNNPATLTTYPLATPMNLATALQAAGRLMDSTEDVLVLFLTSHGAPREGLTFELHGRELGLLTPRGLAVALASAGIRLRIVIVSACFSGQFVPALRDDRTLVITAAAANRSSFGCTNTAEWTWFGEAYFKRALPAIGRFVPAFRRARLVVAERERRSGYPSSTPQLSLGTTMARVLRASGF